MVKILYCIAVCLTFSDDFKEVRLALTRAGNESDTDLAENVSKPRKRKRNTWYDDLEDYSGDQDDNEDEGNDLPSISALTKAQLPQLDPAKTLDKYRFSKNGGASQKSKTLI